MENNEIHKQETIDLRDMFAKLKSHKKLFIKVACIAFVVSTAWILPVPRTYTTTVVLAPEVSSLSGGGALSDLASNFGFDLGVSESADAIYPTLYPDIMGSTTFAISLFDIHVKNVDGTIDTSYYDYLNTKQKSSFWMWPVNYAKRMIAKYTAEPEKAPAASAEKSSKKYDEFFYSRRQDMIITMIQNRIKCSVDKKTDVITFSITDQDRLICAMLADSIRQRLQDYIIEYRTRKARVDVEYYARMKEEARADYEQALARYSGYADAHFDMYLQSTQSKKEALENDVQMKLSVYNTVAAQHQSAMSKLQARTPSFTVIQPAVVPQKPTSPKRMIFILGMVFLSILGTALWVLRKDITPFYSTK